MENKGALCDNIIRYNALQKRKVYLDSIAQGLDEIGIFVPMKYFPDLFSCMFIPSTEVVASDILNIMKYPKGMNDKEKMVAGFIKECVKQLSQCG